MKLCLKIQMAFGQIDVQSKYGYEGITANLKHNIYAILLGLFNCGLNNNNLHS